MLIKVQGISTDEVRSIFPGLIDYLYDSKNVLAHEALGLKGKSWEELESMGLSPDVTSGGIYVCVLKEFSFQKTGWKIVVEVREDVFQSELFECDYSGGLPLFKTPRRFVEPVITYLQGSEARFWKISFRSIWRGRSEKFDGCLVDAPKHETSYRISPRFVYDLFDEVGVFPVEEGARAIDRTDFVPGIQEKRERLR